MSFDILPVLDGLAKLRVSTTKLRLDLREIIQP